ncbi:MAG: chorismate synthase [Lachnospiraceae bacterium]|nr:chorismate synthase [Lachnospiraceae bacterium]
MSSGFGSKLRIQVFGQSHSPEIGVVIDGLPCGMILDMDRIQKFIDRRKGGKNAYSTKRVEADVPEIVSGVVDGVTCGAPLCALFKNQNFKKEDYEKTSTILRPSHADFTAWVKYGGYQDKTGGGMFSGRLTLPMVFAGAVCEQYLEKRGITVSGRIVSIGGIENDEKAQIELMEKVASEGDSVGGIVECEIKGVPAGVGEPLYDSVESEIAHIVFGIPAVKGIEFGMGFAGVSGRGSEVNDEFYIESDAQRETILTRTNNSGGIQGGITNGMPIVFRVAIKPTPTIYKKQNSVDIETFKDVELEVTGRHDPCIVPRALPCVEAAAAIAITDLYLQR